MRYFRAGEGKFKCSEDAYLQMVRLLASGTPFFYKDFADKISEFPEGAKPVDLGSMTREEAQQVIGG